MPLCAKQPRIAVLILFSAAMMPVMTADTAAAQERRPEGPDRLTGFVGGGAGLVPDYEGSDGYRVLIGPVFDLRYGNWYANLWDGFGYDVIDTEKVEVGVGLTYVRGRKAKHSPEGVGRLDHAIGSHAYVRYYLMDEVSLTAGLTHSYGGSDGTLAELALKYRFRPAKRVLLFPSVSATWASGKYMQGYFGINEQQAARSGLPVFDADSGLKEISASVTAAYALNRHWHLSGTTTLKRYMSDAKNSPLNERKWQPTGFIGLAYRF